MKGIDKNTSIILLIVLIFGVLFAGALGFICGKNISDKKNTESKIEHKFEEKEKKESEEVHFDISAASDIEFITDLRGLTDKFNNKECTNYVVNYNNIKVTINGKSIVGNEGYNIKDLIVEVNGSKINTDLKQGNVNEGYLNNIDVGYLNDGVNSLFTIIINSKDGFNYIISFNQNGEVLLNDESNETMYNIETVVQNNIEVSNILSTYMLGKEVLSDTCSDGYLKLIENLPLDTVIYSRKTYNYVNNALNEIANDSRTINDDKILKACP